MMDLPDGSPEKGGGTDSNGWLATYSDMVTLLFAFFVLLFAISTIDANKFNALVLSLSNKGVPAEYIMQLDLDNPDPVDPNSVDLDNPLLPVSAGALNRPPEDGTISLPGVTIEDAELNEMAQVIRDLQDIMQQESLENEVDVSMRERGVVISINTQILFASGSAELEAESLRLMGQISKALERFPNHQICVEGHTDNVPIHSSRYPSNWELSSARANNVLRYMISISALEPKNLSALGYGEYRPKASNDTAEGRSQNRRVNIVILKDFYRAAVDVEP